MASADVGVETRSPVSGTVNRIAKCMGISSGKKMIMLRVSKREERSRTTVIVDGQLSKDYVEVVETSCNEAISTGKIVQLFLRHVSTVDDSGRVLLSRLAAKGVRLRASGVYTSHLVRELSLTTVRPQSRPSGARCDTGTCEREAEDTPPDD
jgi:hypothetical protein